MARTRTRRYQRPRARRRAELRAKARESRRRKLLAGRIARIVFSVRTAALLALAGLLVSGSWLWTNYRPLPALVEPAATDLLASYRVLYDVRETATKNTLRQTERFEVRRPFEARIETWRGAPPGEELMTGSISNREFFWSLVQGGEVKFGVRRQPSYSHRDASIAVFRAAARAGVVDEVGTATVAGRRCTRFAYAEPRPQLLQPPTKEGRVVSCVDDDGIVLEDDWAYKGRRVLRNRAIEVDTAPASDDERFFLGREPDPALEANALASQQQAFTENRDPEKPVREPKVPSGFTLDRRGMLFDSGGGQGQAPRNSYIESYRRGTELVVVEQGSSLASSPPWSRNEGTPVRLDRRLTGRMVFYQGHVEVRTFAVIEEGTTYSRVLASSQELAVYFARTLVSG